MRCLALTLLPLDLGNPSLWHEQACDGVEALGAWSICSAEASAALLVLALQLHPNLSKQEHVCSGAGESYEENAAREIEEEMGVTGVDLKKEFDFFYSDEVSRLWGRLFSCQYEGNFTLDPEEVESGQFMSIKVQTSWPRAASQ